MGIIYWWFIHYVLFGLGVAYGHIRHPKMQEVMHDGAEHMRSVGVSEFSIYWTYGAFFLSYGIFWPKFILAAVRGQK